MVVDPLAERQVDVAAVLAVSGDDSHQQVAADQLFVPDAPHLGIVLIIHRQRRTERLAEQVRTAGGAAPADLYAALLQVVEPALLDDVMKRLNGNRWVAAQWLGLNRATVRLQRAI